MDAQDLRRLQPDLDVFLARYAPLFGRDEAQAHAQRFVQGLLLGGERRSVENIAEAIDGCVVRSLQKFIAQSTWQAADVLAELRQQVAETWHDPEAVLNVDETGFPKKGTKSVGVKRQYSGTLGRTDNCQVGVFLNYWGQPGHTFLDRRLFLPQEWADDTERRAAAGVPASVVFRTKPALALEMVADAVASGLAFRWVGGDSLYGDSPTFVQGVRALSKWYVLDTSSAAHVWLQEPEIIPAGTQPARGRPTTQARAATKPVPVPEAVAHLPASAWQPVAVAEGSQGPRMYEYAELQVWFSEEGLPSGPERLLVRRSLSQQETDVKYQRSNAPATIPLAQVAAVGGCRWSIEQDIQAAKGECGLDEYETRGWLGWHHHTALSVLALWFLAWQRQRLGEKRAPAQRARSAGRPRPSARPARVGCR